MANGNRDSDDNPRWSAGGPVDSARATLAVYGQDLDPAKITVVAGVEPSHAHRKGDRISPRTDAVRNQGAWLLRIAVEKPKEPEEALIELLDSLPSDGVFWTNLIEVYEVRLSIGLSLQEWNRGFTLSADIVRRVAVLGISLDFDIYFVGAGR